MQITFNGSMEELVAFAEQIRPLSRVSTAANEPIFTSQPVIDVGLSPKKEKAAQAAADKVADKVVEKIATKLAEKATPEKTAEKPTEAAKGSTETPIPPQSNGPLDVLKSMLANLIRAKGNAAVSTLLGKYGATKVSEVKTGDIETMIEEAKALIA